MDVGGAPLPTTWVVASFAAALGALAWALWAAPWRRFASSEAAHVWYGTIFALTVLWSVRAVVGGAVVIHLLGTAGFALAAGAPLALIGGALVVGITALIQGSPLANTATVFLLGVVLPVAVMFGVLRATQRFLPANFFVYVLAAAFFGAALALGASGLGGAAVVAATGGPETAALVRDLLPYLLYLAFAEGTLTGMVITLLVVYRPHWVATFDDSRYLDRQ
jgi:uncharacterized membrane protein